MDFGKLPLLRSLLCGTLGGSLRRQLALFGGLFGQLAILCGLLFQFAHFGGVLFDRAHVLVGRGDVGRQFAEMRAQEIEKLALGGFEFRQRRRRCLARRHVFLLVGSFGRFQLRFGGLRFSETLLRCFDCGSFGSRASLGFGRRLLASRLGGGFLLGQIGRRLLGGGHKPVAREAHCCNPQHEHRQRHSGEHVDASAVVAGT